MANKHEKYFVEGYFGVWRTVGGRRIFIRDDEPLDKAMKRSGKFNQNKNQIVKVIITNKEVVKYINDFNPDLKHDSVILLKERNAHILERKREDVFNYLIKELSDIVNNPDYIYPDSKNKDTLIFVKNFNNSLNVIIKLAIKDSNENNSVITAFPINKKRFSKLLEGIISNNISIYNKK